MERRFLLSPILAASLGIAAAFAFTGTGKAVTTITDTPFEVTCTSSGQVCDHTYQQNVVTSSLLTLAFESAWDGCASFSVSFYVDGGLVYSSAPLAPFQSTPTVDAGPVAAGAHLVEVRATGVTGGDCDDGTLRSWAGRLTVTTNDDPVAEPPQPPATPSSPEQCKRGGWQTFADPAFKNQGQCVSFVEHQVHRGAR